MLEYHNKSFHGQIISKFPWTYVDLKNQFYLILQRVEEVLLKLSFLTLKLSDYILSISAFLSSKLFFNYIFQFFFVCVKVSMMKFLRLLTGTRFIL
jgi:hypothetical protein